MKRCPVCRGQKRVCKLGGVIVDCEECKAVGFIDTKIVMDEPVVESAAKDEVKEIVKEPVKSKAVVKNKGKARKVKK